MKEAENYQVSKNKMVSGQCRKLCSSTLENDDSKKLAIFVGGLSSRTTKQDLDSYFFEFGSIQSCEPQMWKKSKERCRGFALVYCGDQSTYDRILETKKHVFKGRNIECKRCFTSKDKLNKYNKDLIERKVFVGGIPLEATNQDMEALFSEIGEIDIAYIITHYKTGRSKGFGYICFKEKRARDKALEIKDFHLLGKVVSCSEYSHKFMFKKTKSYQNQSNKIDQHTSQPAEKEEAEPVGKDSSLDKRAFKPCKSPRKKRKEEKETSLTEDEDSQPMTNQKKNGVSKRCLRKRSTTVTTATSNRSKSSLVSELKYSSKLRKVQLKLLKSRAAYKKLENVSLTSIEDHSSSGSSQKKKDKYHNRKKRGFSLFGSAPSNELFQKYGINF